MAAQSIYKEAMVFRVIACTGNSHKFLTQFPSIYSQLGLRANSLLLYAWDRTVQCTSL
jgi:hypothetical protein